MSERVEGRPCFWHPNTPAAYLWWTSDRKKNWPVCEDCTASLLASEASDPAGTPFPVTLATPPATDTKRS